MDGETASSVDEQLAASRGGAGGGSDTTGKHRILAELKRVEQESKFLEKELEELDKTENVSTICEELLRFIESRPDPLLSVTNGPINPVWDRWFEGPQDAQGCRYKFCKSSTSTAETLSF
ncbi:guanine nucleotide-binding protein subunit gamma 2-like [Melia azedarach]|uniref:Guanine nucleotide-binding protein subunit gamma 2-like n=1 Tax=Melia azedarach TaxID=155640 RepID=A0ACC1YW20_MELAZ|nr:guanine nucleotide-binding protein subunit gamma 2-like [Melia azedarach]